MFKGLFIFCAFLNVSHVLAQENLKVIPDRAVQKKMYEHNLHLQRRTKLSFLGEDFFMPPGIAVERPYAEYETAKYLLFSADDSFLDAYKAKKIMLDNLPSGVTAIIYSYWSGSLAETVYKNHLDSGRARIVTVGGYNGFWARDGIPVPVYAKGDRAQQVALIDARYGHGFEPDRVVLQF
jgi:hypothetical protein